MGIINDQSYIALVIFVIIWVLPWKGYAMWRAAERREKWWFVAIFIINTMSILDIFYVFFVANKEKAMVVEGGEENIEETNDESIEDNSEIEEEKEEESGENK